MPPGAFAQSGICGQKVALHCRRCSVPVRCDDVLTSSSKLLCSLEGLFVDCCWLGLRPCFEDQLLSGSSLDQLSAADVLLVRSKVGGALMCGLEVHCVLQLHPPPLAQPAPSAPWAQDQDASQRFAALKRKDLSLLRKGCSTWGSAS